MFYTLFPEALVGTGWEGHVKWNMPSYIERKMLIKEFGLKFNGNGSVDMAGIDMTDLISKMVEKAKKHIVEINIFNKETGENITSFEQLEHDPRFDSVVDELSSFLIKGGSLGKKLG